MSAHAQPAPDRTLVDLADYVLDHTHFVGLAFETARHSLIDSVGCALDALADPECRKLLGPQIRGTHVPGGARVPGTAHPVDPVKAAFDLGTMIAWLDRHDSWSPDAGASARESSTLPSAVAPGMHAAAPAAAPARPTSHPSVSIGGLLAAADWSARAAAAAGDEPATVRDLLGAIVQAYEIHGALAAADPGLHPCALTRIATAAPAARLLGLDRRDIIATLSLAAADGQPLPGRAQPWLAGDAAARAVQLALRVRSGEPGCAAGLPTFSAPLGSRVVESTLFRLDVDAPSADAPSAEAAADARPPLGHRSRRAEGVPVLEARFRRAVERSHPARAAARIVKASLDSPRLAAMPVHAWVDLFDPG